MVITVKKLKLSDFPETKVVENDHAVRFRVDYSKDKKLFPEDIDAIRLLTQLSFRQPFFNLESVEYKGTPRQHYILEHMLKYIPVKGIDQDICRIRQVIVKCKVFNQFKEVCSVSTKDLEIYVDKQLIKSPYKGDHHSILRLRKDEGVSFVANLEWNDDDIIEANQQVILFPHVRHNLESRQFDMLMESRCFWTCHEIMQKTCKLMITKLKRYLEILSHDYSNELDHIKYEKNSKIKVLHFDNSATFLTLKIEAENPNLVDFDLAIKNIICEIVNAEDRCVFMFEHFKKLITISISGESKLKSIIKGIQYRIELWDTLGVQFTKCFKKTK